jgi:predicted alpha/beta-hydrolase family hydrolase
MLTNGPTHGVCTIVLGHGAGAPMDTEFMTIVAEGLADLGFHVVRFEFPYMALRRQTGKKRPPDREPVLRKTWLEVIGSLGPAENVIIGGKSMGGRIASLIADEAQVAGLVCLGYPFHPTGKPEKLRTEHLKSLATPTLILQGERDPLGKPEEVATYALPRRLKIQWLPDGDHSFKPRKSSGITLPENLATAIAATAKFAHRVVDSKSR